MATITSAGIGSGLDIEGLVAKLLSAERAPRTAQLDKSETKVQAQLSAVGLFKSALSDVQAKLEALQDDTVFGKLLADSGDSAVFTASANASATSGIYSIEVLALASAHKLGSTDFDSATMAVGTGTLTITSGATSFDVTIADGASSLNDIRDAINAASGNSAVRASVVNSADGAHLVLTALNTGADNAISVTQAGGDGGLAALVYDPATSTYNMSEKQEALDARVMVEGFLYEGSSNTITDAIAGVTINLAKEKPGTKLELNVHSDSSGVATAVKAFVGSYNALVKALAQLTSYNPTTKAAGPLLGDATALSVSQQLRRVLGDQVGTGVYNTLSSIGVTTSVDGQLTVDSTKLADALKNDADGIAALFNGGNGIATRIASSLESYLASDGAMQARIDGANARIKDISKQREALALRMTALEKQYRTQFTALDSLVGQLQSTSNFLTQQLSALANLAGISKKS